MRLVNYGYQRWHRWGSRACSKSAPIGGESWNRGPRPARASVVRTSAASIGRRDPNHSRTASYCRISDNGLFRILPTINVCFTWQYV